MATKVVKSIMKENNGILFSTAPNGSGSVEFASPGHVNNWTRPHLEIRCKFPTLYRPFTDSFIDDIEDNGGHFGDHWENKYDVSGKYKLLHLGSDFPASAGTTINAIHDGTVVLSEPRNDRWGGYLAVEYEFTPGYYVTTTYTHVIPTLAVGATVKAGASIGSVYPLASGPHLHLQMRFGKMDSTLVKMGRLPEHRADTRGLEPVMHI
jgi:murein DD-endopeptidase MepM/ murein hydrolase activator NlpD